MAGLRGFRREREFGLLVGGILCLIGLWWLFRRRGGALPGVLLSAGAILVLLGALLPSLLGVPYRAWMKLAEALSFVMTNVILALVYFGIVTPIGLLRKAFGGDPLRRRSRPAASYWFPYSDRQRDPRHYEKMF
ncbi:MAG: SxtJ family membrane protein [Thermoanaerobaculia bacterium]